MEGSNSSRVFPNRRRRPSNTILAERLTPEILGALVAQEILPSLAKDAPLPEDDSSTVALLKWYREG